jgi:signal transduction histidine kinase
VDLLVPARLRAPHPEFRAGFAADPETRPMGAGRDLYGLRSDGTEVPIEIGLNPIHSEDGLLVLSSIVDITERKNAEREREQLLDREKAARETAELANRLKDEFLATLSHELRTPLNAILGWGSLLSEAVQQGEPPGEFATKGLDTIVRSARLQMQLIDDLLDVSRIVSGKLQLTMQPVELHPVVRSAIDTIRPTAEIKGVHLRAHYDDDAGVVAGDPARLQQIVWNLLSNAIRFTPRGGEVTVRTELTEAGVELTVRDTGSGISPDFLPHIFDRFRQADGSLTREHGGLGLGLSIVKQLVELHGGSIRARSDGPGRGAAFTVRLPRSVARQRGTPSREHRPAPRLDGTKVLMVEDDDDARELMHVILVRAGAEVCVASSAAAAMEAFRTFSPDVIVSDIGMPEEDGYSLLRRIRMLDHAPAEPIPAIALTAHARPEDRDRALEAGFVTHVSKPVEPDTLIEVIARLRP